MVVFQLAAQNALNTREYILLNEGWKFFRYDSVKKSDSLIYDVRPEVTDNQDGRPADAKPTEAVKIKSEIFVLKPWILPTGNNFIKDRNKRYLRPAGNPGFDFPFVQADFDDSKWENINLPHDWAIKGPFYKEENAVIGGGMGRLPVHGVAWYRKKLDIPHSDNGKSIHLVIEGAMSYAMVWLNGKLIGGWPYGYSSWYLDLTPYIQPGKINQLAIRLDNPPSSARWYPGGGIYRNVWLLKTNPVHISQWGTFITSRNITKKSAIIDLKVNVENTSGNMGKITIATEVYKINADGSRDITPVVSFRKLNFKIDSQSDSLIEDSVVIPNPLLWGPLPNQKPNRYVALTTLYMKGKPIDVFETTFGIRELKFDANKGVFVNGEHVPLNGVNQHHDLGALGAAFNLRAAERQLEILRDMGCNAIRMSHNPPAPELLDLTDRMGFLVIDEIFDVWERKKTPLDFHLIFPDWHEQDLRALIRRDRNHPSVFLWSFGNELGEQYTGEDGAKVARMLYGIVKDEDISRPATIAMNYAKPDMPLPSVVDVIGLNYQGEGIRDGGAYKGLKGITTPPLFPAFHSKFPEKVILSSENASAVSSRGVYLFPVFDGNSSPIKDGVGGDSKKCQVSAYELYSVDFGASADKVFTSLDKHPFVAGGFVWTGWDYLGEPTPYYRARSSYTGIIDLAGFKKDRFYLYQSYWRPEYPMAHILPHWNWPERTGNITPVHIFTSGDEAELFLNGKSMGKKKKGAFEYRLRWDSISYEPGILKVIAYKRGNYWASDSVITTSNAFKIELLADRTQIKADGNDLSFITARIVDRNGLVIPNACNNIRFKIQGNGSIVATDNGDASNLISFVSHEREAFNGLCLVIVKGENEKPGKFKLIAESELLQTAEIIIESMDTSK